MRHRDICSKRILLGMLVCLSWNAPAQDKDAALLHRAVHCLAAKGFLENTGAREFRFGYFIDENSYPDENMLYLVYYPEASKLNGAAFIIFLTERGAHQRFDIQNNASFLISKHGDEGVSFVNPPLGGMWTQEHLVSAIKKIGARSTVTISADSLLAVNASFSCEAYTDPQSESATK